MGAMSAVESEPEQEYADLLPDDLLPKGQAVPLVRTPAQRKRVLDAEVKRIEEQEIHDRAKRLAQIVNLHIAGYSLADIGASIGATEAEVDRMLTQDTARYVRSQPALRTYVRNYISGKYASLLEAVWDEATDKTHKDKLENQDRALRILDRMAKLHGAEMPTQAEVKMDATPEAVDRLVQALAASNGMGYDTAIFDTVPGEVVHDAVEESAKALEVSGNQVEEAQPGDEDSL
jgi:hypothetical protein